MIYILFVLVLIIGGVWWYMKKNILLPSNVDQLIDEIKAEGVPELMPGRHGYVLNDNTYISYEVIEPISDIKGNVLLLNGHGQTMLGYPIHFYQPLLDAGYQVIRMDNRGTGESSWVNDWTKETAFNLEDMAADAIAVLDELNIEKVHIAGYSMGGMIAQSLVINYPERFLSLTSMMSAGYYNDPELTGMPRKFFRKFVLVLAAYARGLSKLRNKLKLQLAINRLLIGSVDDGFDDKIILQKAFYENTRRSGYNKNVEPLHSRAIYLSGSRYEDLQKLTIPSLVIHGTEDPLVLFENAEKYAPMIPNAQTLYIKGLGHHFPKKYMAEIIEGILANFELAEKSEFNSIS